MAFLVALVVLVGLLCVIDLLLTIGVIRRLREHTELLRVRNEPPGGLPVGSIVDEFAGADTDGRPVTRDSLPAGTLVAFLSSGCAPCEEMKPRFVEAAGMDGEPQALAVVSGPGSRELAAQLSAVARVVVEDDTSGPVCAAFQVQAFPTLYRLGPGGRVTATGPEALTPAGSRDRARRAGSRAPVGR
ncbi:TlpA family protein disulfide reductase [Actinomadura rudentiformis]|uniref:Thioredoxin domain-containing protein n=1 Tax=Actinomadura rudentiformis TaxID=359158 RepID=A0A6H9Y6E3_9ACTN|nr:hypothetical protein [Actinomadura rudentiformis]KAB2339802.1 hypothetical protein F8566_46900 [Actinomadura rudentiformis]